MKYLLVTIAALLLAGCGPSDIHKAASKGDIKAIKSYLDSGVNVNAKDHNGATPLEIVVDLSYDKNHIKILQGTDVKLSHYNHKKIVEILISKGANIYNKYGMHDKDGAPSYCKVLDEAIDSEETIKRAKKRNVEKIRQINNFIKINNYNYKEDATASYKNNIKIANEHISNFKKIIELLVDNGADVNARSIFGSPLIDSASGETLALLKRHGAKTSAEMEFEKSVSDPLDMKFHYAAEGGAIKLVLRYLDAGKDVNSKASTTGGTALHYSAKNGQEEMVNLLISKGADVNARNNGNLTPLHYATTPIVNVDVKVAKLLIDKGANVNAKDSRGMTPLDRLENQLELNERQSTHSLKKIADLLRKHGGNPDEELKPQDQ